MSVKVYFDTACANRNYSETVYPDADMNVIVQREQAGAQEYMMYTSIRDL